MKKFLFIALAALGFAACADKMDDVKSPAHNGEVEESYIAINLMAADVDSRAAEDEFGYEDGTPAERVINSAYFFFFDENGSPFNILGAPGTAPGGSKNHMQLTIGEYTGKDDPNVSDIRKAILVLSTYKGIYPSQVVAVLNWTPSDRAYTLKELQEEVVDNSLGNDTNGYVMSNSVYSNGTKIMAATPIAEENIKKSETDAIAAPVDIYVERTAAKVVVTNTKFNTNNNRYQVTDDNGFKPVGDDARTVYVELLGWELYNEFNKTNIVKSIENWESIGLTWNDSPFFRSYWAETMNVRTTNDTFAWKYADPASKGLPTEYGYAVASEANYAANTYAYCGENTLDWTTNDVRTKVILKGRLVEEDGDTLELARWYGNEYAGTYDLKTAVAGSLAYTVFYANPAYDSNDPESPMYISIAPEHIEIVHGKVVGAEAYEVGFQLTTAAEDLDWYLYSSEGGHERFGELDVDGSNAEATNAHLANVQPAVLYTGGDTYYIVDIKHLGAPDTTTTYGIVRNHVYQLDIQSIKGYGSPGYSGFSHTIENPEYPADDETSSYVAAKINVLSWKVVKQGVDIVQ